MGILIVVIVFLLIVGLSGAGRKSKPPGPATLPRREKEK